MAPADSRVRIEVVYALAGRQVLLEVEVEVGTTVDEAITLSGIAHHFPGLDLGNSPVGIFGKPVKRDQRVKDGDRIEIYRPLVADPKLARRKRAGRKR